MGDMGLQGAYGAQGAAEALRQLIKDRLERQQVQFNNERLLAGDARQNRQLDQNDQIRRDTLAETARQHQSTAADRVFRENTALNEQMAPGTFLEDAPAQQRIIGRLQSVGGVPMTPNQDERPKVDVGPLLPGDTGAEKKRGYLKLASSKQLDTQADNERQLKATSDIAGRDAEIVRHNKAMENKPVSEQGWTIQQGMVEGKPGWVRINSRTGEVRPVAPGEITPKPSAQEAEHNRTNKETHDTLNQLDQAIENAKDLIGPGAGRISNLEQMAGSADPRIQALGVKMKAAKMRVDHAVTGSVRAGASPQMMQQWDNILANKVTPEGLKAGVQAMREILGGGNTPAASGSGIKSITEIK